LQLQRYSDSTSLTVISLGYRLAPEDPYPRGNEDCFDVAEFLVDLDDEGRREYGGELMFIGGDSAGAHLSVLTVYRLLVTRKEWGGLRGLVLNFGVFDLGGFLPEL
jgi:acetyl esterase/lipase